MLHAPFKAPIAESVWASRYRFYRAGEIVDRTPADTWARVAATAAALEGPAAPAWQARFSALLHELAFLPGGRILAGAGTGRRVTLSNCFVIGGLADDLSAVFDTLRDAALIMQAGGGVGCDFSPLRPAGDRAETSGQIASGPVSFMRMWDVMCATIAAGARRGAMMATLRVDHPDILAFVHAKQDRRSLTHFNCSVLVTDAFIAAVARDAQWPLVFGGRVYRQVRARTVWDALTRNAWESSEPGVLFIDRINAENNLAYREQLTATNPCGEVPLPPHGACQLGSFNLTGFVRAPFSKRASFDHAALASQVPVAVRLLDNLLDTSYFPLPAQRAEAHATRRIGIGFMGLGSALIMLGLHYDSPGARTLAAEIGRTLRDSAYQASIDLARSRGAFPALDRAAYLTSPFVARLPAALRSDLSRYGIRNSHLLAIAPTGTISLLANNVSSGIEPVFRASYTRTVQDAGRSSRMPVEDYAYLCWREQFGAAALPDTFATARALAPSAHLLMQAAVQPFVDQAIAKTINVPADIGFDPFQRIYLDAHRLRLKGITTFRPRADRPGVLQERSPRSATSAR